MSFVLLATCLASLCLLQSDAQVDAQQDSASVLTGAVMSQLNSQDSDINWNDIVDFILDSLRDELKTTGKARLVLPNIETEFDTKWSFMKIKGTFSASSGEFKDLSTIYRTADVVVEYSQATEISTLSCALGIRDVHVSFEEYILSLKNLKQPVMGSISGSVGKNSIELKIAVDMGAGKKCEAGLLEFRVAQLDDVKFKVTGFGVLNGLVSKLISGAVESRKSQHISKIEEALTHDVEEALKKLSCDL